MNGARWFQRREEYQPPETHRDSPFRKFVVHCLRCNSCRVRVIAQHCEDSGETKAFLFCPACRIQEELPLR